MITITTLTNSIERLLSKKANKEIIIKGEISDYNIRKGHAWMELKDENSSIQCVIWNYNFIKINSQFENGNIVEASGKISFYKKRGEFKFIINKMKLHSNDVGDKQKQLKIWDKECEKNGFYEKKKKKIQPEYNKISIITSQKGAAIKDCLSVIQRRCPKAKVYIHDCIVQGENCPLSVKQAFEKSLQSPSQVIILCRGGGSKDDLFYFNHPIICKTVYECSKPVITGIGHQPDTHLVDKISDLSCSTPSVASEKTCQDSFRKLERMKILLSKHEPTYKLNVLRHKLKIFRKSIISFNMKLKNKIENSKNIQKERIEARLNSVENKINLLSPVNVLSRGYCIIRDSNGQICTSVNEVKDLDSIVIEMKDGSFEIKI